MYIYIYTLHKKKKIKRLEILIILANMHMKNKTIIEYRATNC